MTFVTYWYHQNNPHQLAIRQLSLLLIIQKETQPLLNVSLNDVDDDDEMCVVIIGSANHLYCQPFWQQFIISSVYQSNICIVLKDDRSNNYSLLGCYGLSCISS